MAYVVPLKICFMNHNSLNHQVRISAALLHISVALPTAFQVDSSCSFKAKLFHPHLCSAGTSTFAIYNNLTCWGWKQRKYWKMEKIYTGLTQRTLSFFFPVFTALPGCLMEWFNNNPWLQPWQRPRWDYICAAGAENQHGAGMWLLADLPASLGEITFKKKINNAFKCSRMYGCMCFIYICITLFLEVLYWQQ